MHLTQLSNKTLKKNSKAVWSQEVQWYRVFDENVLKGILLNDYRNQSAMLCFHFGTLGEEKCTWSGALCDVGDEITIDRCNTDVSRHKNMTCIGRVISKQEDENFNGISSTCNCPLNRFRRGHRALDPHLQPCQYGINRLGALCNLSLTPHQQPSLTTHHSANFVWKTTILPLKALPFRLSSIPCFQHARSQLHFDCETFAMVPIKRLP